MFYLFYRMGDLYLLNTRCTLTTKLQKAFQVDSFWSKIKDLFHDSIFMLYDI